MLHLHTLLADFVPKERKGGHNIHSRDAIAYICQWQLMLVGLSSREHHSY